MEKGATSFGDALRGARERRGLTQSQLAERAEISRRSIIRWETSEVSPWVPELESVINALELSQSETDQLTKALTSNRAMRAFDSERMAKFAVFIGVARRRADITHVALAHHFGCDPATVRRWESGRLTPSPEEFHQLLAVLKISAEELSFLNAIGDQAPETLEEFYEALRLILSPLDVSSMTLFDVRFLWLLRQPTVCDNPRWKAHVQFAYAWMLITSNRHREAVKHAEEAKSLYEQTRHPADRSLLATTILLARSHGSASKVRGPQTAIRMLEELEKRPLDWRLLASRLDAYAEVHARSGATTKALAYSDRALSAAKNCGPKMVKLMSFNRARIHLIAGQPGYALEAVIGLSDSSPLQNALEARTLCEIHDLLGKNREAQHWSSLADHLCKRHGLEQAFSGDFLWMHPLIEAW